jgi:predicted Zn-dependent peptidase
VIEKEKMKPEFFKKKLKNGLTVIFEKRNLPVVSVSASVRFGSIFETEKNKGISHLMEHLMFKGTKKRSQQEIAGEVEKKGGILNAFTSEEVTSYWNKLPSKYLQTAIEIPSDLIVNPQFDPVEFEKEKNVVIEEIKMYRDNPSYHVNDKIKEMLYEKPFGMSIAGNEEIVRNLGREEAIKLFNSVYTSDSMILAVVGDADFDYVCKLGDKLFPTKTRKLAEFIPVKKNAEMTEERKGIDQSHFVFGFHVPVLGNREKYDYEVAGAWLFGGMSSRLFQEVREKRGLAYSIKGDFDLGKNYGYCMISAGTLKEKIKEIKEIILKEIKDLKNLGKKDFDECREQLIGSRKLAEEDSSNVMNSLMMEEISGKAEEYYRYEERINSVKLEDVRKLAKLKAFSSFSLIPKI